MPTSKSGPPPASFLLRDAIRWGEMLKPKADSMAWTLPSAPSRMMLDGLEVGGLVVAAVGDHELDVGGLAGGDHGFAIGDGGGHGLLAKDVLAGLGGADGVLGVHGVGQGDVDGVDGGVVGDFVEVFVVVDGAGGDAVLGGDAGGFVAMAADKRGDLGVGGELDAGHEVAGDAAETDDGVADFAVGGGGCGVLRCGVLGAEGWREAGSKGEGGEPGKVATGEVGHGWGPRFASRVRIADRSTCGGEGGARARGVHGFPP